MHKCEQGAPKAREKKRIPFDLRANIMKTAILKESKFPNVLCRAQKIMMRFMADQGRYDFPVVFTMTLCTLELK